MWSILALGAVERLIHQCINLDAISRIQFNALQGKILRVVIDSPQLSIDVYFDVAKIRLEPTITGQQTTPSIFEQRPFDQQHVSTPATTTLHVNNTVELLKLFFAEDIGNIPLQGDYHLLNDIQLIIQEIQPDLAAQLSPWIGANLAHEIGKIQLAPKHLKRSFASHLFFIEDALKEDSGVFAPRWQMDDLNHSTRQLNQDIDRLEARIQHIQNNLQTQSSIKNHTHPTLD